MALDFIADGGEVDLAVGWHFCPDSVNLICDVRMSIKPPPDRRRRFDDRRSRSAARCPHRRRRPCRRRPPPLLAAAAGSTGPVAASPASPAPTSVFFFLSAVCPAMWVFGLSASGGAARRRRRPGAPRHPPRRVGGRALAASRRVRVGRHGGARGTPRLGTRHDKAQRQGVPEPPLGAPADRGETRHARNGTKRETAGAPQRQTQTLLGSCTHAHKKRKATDEGRGTRAEHAGGSSSG